MDKNVATRSFNRAERVAGQLQKSLASLIRKGVKDPRLNHVTITGVGMSRDLRIAKIFYAAHGPENDHQSIKAGFESAKGFIKRELARELGLRYMPDLKFFYDASFDYGAHIDRVLKSIQNHNETNNSTADEQ
jgi:ribosome-binding factor A